MRATMHKSVASVNRYNHVYPAELHILEQPKEDFLFRYNSDLLKVSLTGANSSRKAKTLPAIELRNFSGHAVIRCSLFQTNVDSPHPHELVACHSRTCDPHDFHVSPEHGYIVELRNMSILYTAKKYLVDELFKKKMSRLQFELGRDKLTTIEKYDVYKETDEEAKEINVHQVRLCFEAFKVEPEENIYTRIAATVYSNPIKNLKSGQKGELRICRLSIATGSVSGGDELILLIERVNKKNIQVRFFELNTEGDVIWEDYAKFKQSDVHHQYAIVCQTPAYKNQDIEKPVEVFIELVRPSDDEHSFPPKTFRYIPEDKVISSKRRRTTSTANNSCGSDSSTSLFELPKLVQEQAATMKLNKQLQIQTDKSSISEECDILEQVNTRIDSDTFDDFLLFHSEDICDLLGVHFEQEGTSSFANYWQTEHLDSTFAPIDKPFEVGNETLSNKNLYHEMKTDDRDERRETRNAMQPGFGLDKRNRPHSD